MYFQKLLLVIIHKFNGERSSMAPYYLLKGKKSGQTIQDVTYFDLHPFFSLYPKLSKEEYNVEISTLLSNNLIEEKEAFIFITEKGLGQIKSMRETLYNGWDLRGNEHIFWRRLDLTVQTLSHFQANEKRFIPNQKDNAIHHFVRGFLLERNFQSSTFGSQFKNQLMILLENPKLLEIHRTLFVYRLSGYKESGLTWEQLAQAQNSTILDMKFQFIECLHILLSDITAEKFPDLYALLKDIYVLTPLTDSATKTSQLFEKGYTIDEIAQMRFLKLNTIEDHVIEIVSANQSFPIYSFITSEQLQRVLDISKQLKTKKLKIIRENASDLSYFQIRLALTKGEEVHG